jgi:hypothetical protein
MEVGTMGAKPTFDSEICVLSKQLDGTRGPGGPEPQSSKQVFVLKHGPYPSHAKEEHQVHKA